MNIYIISYIQTNNADVFINFFQGVIQPTKLQRDNSNHNQEGNDSTTLRKVRPDQRLLEKSCMQKFGFSI